MKPLSWVLFTCGVWLIVSGFVVSPGSGPAMTEEIVLGAVIASLSCLSAIHRSTPGDWLIVLAGLWTVFAPAFINYSGARGSRTNDMIVGVIVVLFGALNAVYRRTPARTVV